MEIETLCVTGGETYVDEGNWKREKTDFPWFQMSSEGKDLVSGICVRPLACRLKRRCSRKVKIILPEATGFSKAIVAEVLFKDDKIRGLIDPDMPI